MTKRGRNREKKTKDLLPTGAFPKPFRSPTLVAGAEVLGQLPVPSRAHYQETGTEVEQLELNWHFDRRCQHRRRRFNPVLVPAVFSLMHTHIFKHARPKEDCTVLIYFLIIIFEISTPYMWI